MLTRLSRRTSTTRMVTCSGFKVFSASTVPVVVVVVVCVCVMCPTLLPSPSALVNKGNTLFVAQQFEKARELYQEALR